MMHAKLLKLTFTPKETYSGRITWSHNGYITSIWIKNALQLWETAVCGWLLSLIFDSQTPPRAPLPITYRPLGSHSPSTPMLKKRHMVLS